MVSVAALCWHGSHRKRLMSILLSVEHVSKTFGGTLGRADLEVLRDVRFEVAAGEIVSIIGPSGCGKTTLLRILHGLEPASSGAVRLAGTRVEGPSASSAIVFQAFNLFPWLSVTRNVAFGLEVARVDPEESLERTRRSVRLVGLEAFANHYPHELSGGMQQRVGLARALAVNPALLLLDEPFGALDAITREELLHEIAGILADTRRTAVFVTHGMDEAIMLSDRILVMSQRPGHVVEDVAVQLERPRSADRVGASPEFIRLRAHLWSLLSQRGGAHDAIG
jgi:NitT/TauT family transport system ATP-binding protein